ncbi:hypothetical protein MHF_0177 [Mycoplasma haemofelis Ohio2]|uniref:Uncharacterized protein n=1 Tax=Mycoplasma haemofelis (strain Ohio2) TaxID=859194 RepID=F6FG10_MYCHI|nr:hypothetical protein MHF_0177 [Mycoplasma haemofelis Ohio2]
MDSKAKLLLGLSGVGTTGGVGAFFAFPHRSKEEERESILTVISSQERRFVLSTSNDVHNAQWGAIVKEIKDDVIAKTEIGDPIDESRLKSWCEETSKKTFYKDDLLIKFDFRCTRNTILTEVIEKLESNKSLIEFNDSAGWTSQYNDYKTNATDPKLQITLEGKKITNSDMSSRQDNDIRDWCKSMNNTLFEGSESDSYKTFTKWCIKST